METNHNAIDGTSAGKDKLFSLKNHEAELSESIQSEVKNETDIAQ